MELSNSIQIPQIGLGVYKMEAGVKEQRNRCILGCRLPAVRHRTDVPQRSGTWRRAQVQSDSAR